jgi:plastocyanin
MCVILALGGCGSSTGKGVTSSSAASANGGASSTSTGSSTGSQGSTSPASHGSTSPASIHIDTMPKFVSPPPGAPVRSGLVQIALRNVSIAPDAIRVKAGTTVKWTNYDPLQYNVTSVSGPQKLLSGNFGQGGSYQVVLSLPGTLHYLCTNYPTTMNGTIEIVR